MKLWRIVHGAFVCAVAIVATSANARDVDSSTMASASSAAYTSSANESNDMAPSVAPRMAMSPSLSPSPTDDDVEAGDETTAPFTPTPTPDFTPAAPNSSNDPATKKKTTTPSSSPPPPPPQMNDINAHPQSTPEPDSQIQTVPVPANEPTLSSTTPEPTQEPTSKPTEAPTAGPTAEPTVEPTPEPTVPSPDPTTLPDPPQADQPTQAPAPTPIPPPTTQVPESPSPPVAMLPSGPADNPATGTDGKLGPFPLPAPSPTLDPDSPSPPRPPQAIEVSFTTATTTTTTADQENREDASTTLSLVAATGSPGTASSVFVPAVEVHVATDSETSTTTTPTTPRPKAYRRGDQIIIVKKPLADGTIVDLEVVVAPAEAPAMLVRSATAMSTGDSDDTRHSSSSRGFISTVVNYVVPLVALVSLVVLVGFHSYAALRPMQSASMSVLARPNQWELLVFITYIQAMASTAQYVVRHAPVFLWEFADAFSWTVFIPFHHSANGVSSTSHTVGNRRRLADVMVLDGLVAFADRVGVDETELLQKSAAGLVITCGGVVLLACAALVWVKFKTWTNPRTTKSGSLFPGATHLVHSHSASELSPVYVVYGFMVVLGVFALYPVTLVATFEIASQVRADQISGSSLAVALLVLMLVSVQLIMRSISALVSIENENEFKTHAKHRVVWGVLSSSECVKYEHRVTTAITWLAMQLTSAILVGCVLSDVWQLGLLLAIDVLFVGTMLVVRPFATGQRLALIFTCAIGIVKAINTSLAFAFVTDSSASSDGHQNASAATGFIVVNALVIMLWFLRIATVAFVAVRNARSQREPAHGHASPSGDANCDENHNSTLFVALPTTRDGHHGPRQAIL